MSDIDLMIQNLLSVARAHDDLPPYEKVTVSFSIGEMALIAKGLGLLAAVRSATK